VFRQSEIRDTFLFCTMLQRTINLGNIDAMCLLMSSAKKIVMSTKMRAQSTKAASECADANTGKIKKTTTGVAKLREKRSETSRLESPWG
jgi:hypothetical protein